MLWNVLAPLYKAQVLKFQKTEERAYYFWHVDDRGDTEGLGDVAAAHGISRDAGRRWRNTMGGSKKHLKQLLLEQWHLITIEESRELIKEMLNRYATVAEDGESATDQSVGEAPKHQ